MTYMSGGIWGLNGFVGAILGGWGSSGGAVVGGLTLGIIQSLCTGILPAGYQDAIAFALLILILYFRPQGLLGHDHDARVRCERPAGAPAPQAGAQGGLRGLSSSAT